MQWEPVFFSRKIYNIVNETKVLTLYNVHINFWFLYGRCMYTSANICRSASHNHFPVSLNVVFICFCCQLLSLFACCCFLKNLQENWSSYIVHLCTIFTKIKIHSIRLLLISPEFNSFTLLCKYMYCSTF